MNTFDDYYTPNYYEPAEYSYPQAEMAELAQYYGAPYGFDRRRRDRFDDFFFPFPPFFFPPFFFRFPRRRRRFY